jgi:hypothetical protein
VQLDHVSKMYVGFNVVYVTFLMVSSLVFLLDSKPLDPSSMPTSRPTPSLESTKQFTTQPSGRPTRQPSTQTTRQSTTQPSGRPTRQPSTQPTGQPTTQPSSNPTSRSFDKPLTVSTKTAVASIAGIAIAVGVLAGAFYGLVLVVLSNTHRKENKNSDAISCERSDFHLGKKNRYLGVSNIPTSTLLELRGVEGVENNVVSPFKYFDKKPLEQMQIQLQKIHERIHVQLHEGSRVAIIDRQKS